MTRLTPHLPALHAIKRVSLPSTLTHSRPDTSTANLHRWICPSAQIPCTHASKGCHAYTTRSSLSTHLESCHFEALSSFFTANDARIQALESTNANMAREMERMKNEIDGMHRYRIYVGEGYGEGLYGSRVSSVRRETNGVAEDRAREVSGARAGPTVTIERTRELSSSTDTTMTRSQPMVSSTEGADLGSASAPTTDNMTEPPSDPPLGSNAPTPADEARAQPASAPANPPRFTNRLSLRSERGARIERHDRPPMPRFDDSRSMFSPSFGSRQTFADWSFQRLSGLVRRDGDRAQAQSGVGGSGRARNELLLEDVEEMRAVILGLAAGMDTMERRHEV